MSYKSHNDLHGLSYCYYADLFKILHCEQLKGIPLPCQLLQPIKLNQWSGKKNQVRGMGNCTVFLSSLYNLSQIWGGLHVSHDLFSFVKWALSSPFYLVPRIILPLCKHFSVSLLKGTSVKIWNWDFYIYVAFSLLLLEDLGGEVQIEFNKYF